MPCSAEFSMTLQTDILSTEPSDFLKQIIFLESFNSALLAAKMGGHCSLFRHFYMGKLGAIFPLRIELY